MNAMPCYNDRAASQYAKTQSEADRHRERLAEQTVAELAKPRTWELGASEANTYNPILGRQIVELLRSGDFTEYGRLVHDYIVNEYAPEVARQEIEKQDEESFHV